MRFLVDAQLPQALAEWLRQRGHSADHVKDLALEAQPDGKVVAQAIESGAVIITKDADFSRLSMMAPNCKVVWIRFGNATSRNLIRRLEPVFSEVEQALEDGQNLVEVSR